jgi:hypothetical protein
MGDPSEGSDMLARFRRVLITDEVVAFDRVPEMMADAMK